ncbi:hypothetical protein AAFF_G00283460 [Aldrovandia affinis]|uniref:Uncharacterized protein n=1 Tax=Aldrovandia affinis TaxID=143900 RepID=A0AAD7X2L4_9TELE|nr:hypothetical protein AAFF_G00283460 [Aldrovandia affinis]
MAAPEVPVRAFKSLSLVDPMSASTSRPLLGETSPLIGSLLQERQEVIARIAQHLNYCDPTAPHIPESLFGGPEAQAPKSPWFPQEEAGLLKKCKEPLSSSPEHASLQEGSPPENERERRSRSSSSDTPLGFSSRAKADGDLRSSPKPAACRKLLLPDPTEGSTISEAVQDISRLIQDTFQKSQSRCTELLHHTYKVCKEDGVPRVPNRPERERCNQSGQEHKGHAPCQHSFSSHVTNNGSGSHICTDSRISGIKSTDSVQQDCSLKPQSEARVKHEDPTAEPEPELKTSHKNAKKDGCDSSAVDCKRQAA